MAAQSGTVKASVCDWSQADQKQRLAIVRCQTQAVSLMRQPTQTYTPENTGRDANIQRRGNFVSTAYL